MDKHWYGIITKTPHGYYRIMYYENRVLTAVVEAFSKYQAKKILIKSNPLAACANYKKEKTNDK